jgi:pyruvate dehydrogenase E1 component alpha subunit
MDQNVVTLSPAVDAETPRSPDFGAIEGLAEACPVERSLELFRRMSLIRHFDLRTQQAKQDGDVECLVYLSVGQEAVASAISLPMAGAYVLGQHRGHSVYLSFGGRPERLVDELLGLPTGCCGGMGGSPPIHDIENRIIGHNGLIGDQVPVAAGVALSAAPGDKVVTFFGDGAAEEDYVLAALGFAASHRLPILFVCEDNDLSVLTPTDDRRKWRLADVARGFGLEAVDIADDPWLVEHWTRELSEQLPAVINVRTCRELWHVGAGSDNNAEWNRFALTRGKLEELGLAAAAAAIDRETEEQVETLWTERLQTRSAR